jgi:hypothetical protein
MSRDELIVVVRRQAGQIAEWMETNEALAGKLARLEHLLSRNSGNSSSPPSRDDDPGKPALPKKNKRDRGGPSGRGASSPVRRGHTWPGPRIPMSAATGFPRAVATVVLIWVAPGIWGSWTATSSTRFHRSP